MAQNTGRAKRSEKGPADPRQLRGRDYRPSAADALWRRQLRPPDDHQQQRRACQGREGFRRAGRSQHRGDQGFSGNMWPQIQAVFPKQTPIERSSMNSWDDENFVARDQKSGKKKIVLAGLWTETCVALPTVQAIHDGYEVYVVEDCCGDVSQLSHDNAMKRVIQAGAKPVTALSVMLEWQRDWAEKDTYDAVMDIVKTHFGAYGVGVEYAYTMVHGAPATKFPEYSCPLRRRPQVAAQRDGTF